MDKLRSSKDRRNMNHCKIMFAEVHEGSFRPLRHCSLDNPVDAYILWNPFHCKGNYIVEYNFQVTQPRRGSPENLNNFNKLAHNPWSLNNEDSQIEWIRISKALYLIPTSRKTERGSL